MIGENQNKRFAGICAKSILVVFVFMLFATQVDGQWDTLYLRNGQTVYGTLKSISLGHVQFDAEDLSVENVKVSKIKTLSASRRIYHIQTTQHDDIYTIIHSSTRDGYVQVGDSVNGMQTIPISYISMLSYFSANKLLWEGNVSLGYSYTKSSRIGRINFDGGIKCILRKGDIGLTASSIFTQDSSSFSRDRETVTLIATYFFNSKWKGAAILNYQRNLELGLASRFQQGLGFGYNFLSKSRMRGDAMTGIVVNEEKSIASGDKIVTAELPLIITYDFFKFSKPDLTLNTTQNIYFSLTQSGRVRQDGEIKIDWKIISDFTVSLKLYDNFDNQANKSQASNFDYGVVFSLGYKFD